MCENGLIFLQFRTCLRKICSNVLRGQAGYLLGVGKEVPNSHLHGVSTINMFKASVLPRNRVSIRHHRGGVISISLERLVTTVLLRVIKVTMYRMLFTYLDEFDRALLLEVLMRQTLVLILRGIIPYYASQGWISPSLDWSDSSHPNYSMGTI